MLEQLLFGELHWTLSYPNGCNKLEEVLDHLVIVLMDMVRGWLGNTPNSKKHSKILEERTTTIHCRNCAK